MTHDPNDLVLVEALYTTMTTANLRHLREAFLLDTQYVTVLESKTFCQGRIAIIEKILKARNQPRLTR